MIVTCVCVCVCVCVLVCYWHLLHVCAVRWCGARVNYDLCHTDAMPVSLVVLLLIRLLVPLSVSVRQTYSEREKDTITSLRPHTTPCHATPRPPDSSKHLSLDDTVTLMIPTTTTHTHTHTQLVSLAATLSCSISLCLSVCLSVCVCVSCQQCWVILIVFNTFYCVYV